MPKLTDTYVRKLPLSTDGTTKYWDAEIKGFGLFVGKRTKTWYFQKDLGGRTSRQLIGRYPVITTAVARQTALELTIELSRGSGKRNARATPTLAAATDDYLARPKLRSEAHKIGLRQQFELHLSDWLHLPLDEITRTMVVQRHAKLAKTPSAGNHLLKYFRTVYNHSRRTQDLPECPTSAIEWYEERPKGEIIADLADWSRVVDDLFNPIHKVFYRLALFTGFRKSELLGLEWKNVHAHHIHLPITKNGRSFDLPILPVHHEILAPMKGMGRRWVFPSPKGQDGRLSSPQRMIYSPHAHRRTFATVAVEAGVMEEVVGRLLNHTPLTVTGQRYAKPSLDALRPHMETVCNELLLRTK